MYKMVLGAIDAKSISDLSLCYLVV